METIKSLFTSIKKFLIGVGPGLFCVGFSIGTGSVVTMGAAGSTYGMSLLWGLILACVFSFVMLEAYGRYTIVSGDTALHAYIKRIVGGRALAIIVLVALIIAELMAMIGIVGILSDLLSEWTKLVFNLEQGLNRVVISIFIILVAYFLIWTGKYTIFEKILIVFVSIMTLSFLTSMFLVIPSPEALIDGIVARVPTGPGSVLLLSALVGTTLTAPTFVMRSFLVKEKGWKVNDLRSQTKDAAFAALFMFLISGSVMACAAGTLFLVSQPVTSVIQMVRLLEPFAGSFAISIFVLGIIGAAMSSIIPIAIIAPVLIGDFRGKLIDMKSTLFRVLTGIAVVCGLIVPVLGTNPIWSMILSQVVQIFPVALVSILIMYLLNRRDIMGERHKAGLLMNIGLAGTILFSLLISYAAIYGVYELITTL
jgi:manganese transport protein